MKFFIDENIPKSVCQKLKDRGYDILDIKEENKFGLSDKEILQLAEKERNLKPRNKNVILI